MFHWSKPLADMVHVCRTEKGTVVHRFCHCSKLVYFWRSIHTATQIILDMDLESPSRYLLNYMTNATLDSDKLRLFLITLQIHLFLYFREKKCR